MDARDGDCLLSCFILSYPVLSCPVLSCPVLSCVVLSDDDAHICIVV